MQVIAETNGGEQPVVLGASTTPVSVGLWLCISSEGKVCYPLVVLRGGGGRELRDYVVSKERPGEALDVSTNHGEAALRAALQAAAGDAGAVDARKLCAEAAGGTMSASDLVARINGWPVMDGDVHLPAELQVGAEEADTFSASERAAVVRCVLFSVVRSAVYRTVLSPQPPQWMPGFSLLYHVLLF